MTNRGTPSRFESEVPPPEELFARIRTAVASTPASKTSTRLRITVALAVIPFLTAAVVLVASRIVYHRPALRVDLATHPTSQLLIVLLLLVGLTLVATLIAVGRGERGLGSGVVSLFLMTLFVTPIYAALTLGSALAAGEAATSSLAGLSPWGLRCLGIAAVVGLVVLISFTAALRRSAPVARRLRGAALGAAAGAWAGLSVFIYCPATEYHHLLVGHVLPIAALTLLGLAAIPRALRP
jgi:hypothetical protein